MAFISKGELKGCSVTPGWASCSMTSPFFLFTCPSALLPYSSLSLLDACFINILPAIAMAKKSAKASNDNGNLSDKENGTGCVSWSSLDDEILMKHLKAVKEKDGMSDNGFKRTVWVAIAELLAQQAPSKVVKTATKCQDHWTTVCRMPFL